MDVTRLLCLCGDTGRRVGLSNCQMPAQKDLSLVSDLRRGGRVLFELVNVM